MIRSISGLYLITDRKISGIDHEEIAERALKGGLRIIQLREKEMPERELLSVALRLREITRRWGTLFIINDHVDIARASDADGVHLGQDDLPVYVAREILGDKKIIGVSTHSIEEAVQAQSSKADYIGFGPIFHTETKNSSTPLGTDIIRDLKKKIYIPVVAIGGINLDNLPDVINAGADAVAVISAIARSGNIAETVKRFVEKITGLSSVRP